MEQRNKGAYLYYAEVLVYGTRPYLSEWLHAHAFPFLIFFFPQFNNVFYFKVLEHLEIFIGSYSRQ